MDVLLLFMLGEKDCFSFWAGTSQLTGSINSIEVEERNHSVAEFIVIFPA